MALTDVTDTPNIVSEMDEALQTLGNTLDLLTDTHEGSADKKDVAIPANLPMFGIEQRARALRSRSSDVYGLVCRLRDRLGSPL